MRPTNPIIRMLKGLLKRIRHGNAPGGREIFSLAQEWAVYEEHVGRFAPPDPKKRFVLIKGPRPIGFFETFNEGVRDGYTRFKAEPFLVQPIDSRPLEIACCQRPQWVNLPAS